MRLQHVAEQIYRKPWLITPSAHASIQQLLESKYSKRGIFEADNSGGASDFFVQREPASLDVNGIGHVHVKGVIGQGLSQLEKTCGNTDTRDVATEIESLVALGAKGILLCIDSPGGTITGTPELADTIAQTAMDIPLFVFSDSQICSAAYWLAAGSTRIITTPSAEIGSIGVYLPWIDRSAMWEKEGNKADPVINQQGTLKAIGFFPSLSDEHRAQLQSQVDRIFSLFHDFVVSSRALNEATIPESSMQGQVFLGLDAIAAGLVDELGSKEEAYAALFNEIDIDLDEPDTTEEHSDSESLEDLPDIEST